MSFPGEHPDIAKFSDDLLGALDNDPQAADRLFKEMDGWLGVQPWQSWQTFVEVHPPQVSSKDLEGPIRARALMLVKRIPVSVASTAPWPDRLVTASENWLHAHTRQSIERGTQLVFLKFASALDCFRPEQITEFRKEAVQDSWAAFFHQGCRRWDIRKGSLRTLAHVVANRRTVDYLRRLLRRSPKPLEDRDTDQAALRDLMISAELYAADLDRFLQTLRPEQRDIFNDYFIEGWNGREIGERKDMTTQSVYSAVYAIMKISNQFYR